MTILDSCVSNNYLVFGWRYLNKLEAIFATMKLKRVKYTESESNKGWRRAIIESGAQVPPDWFGSFVSELPRPLVLFPTMFFFIILFLLSIIKIIRFLLSWDSIRFFMYKRFYELMGFARWWVGTKKGICICLHTFIYYIMYVFIYMHVLRQCTTFNNLTLVMAAT